MGEKIQEAKYVIEQNKKEDFSKKIKIDIPEEKTTKEVETLICDGDELGIQSKISY